MPNNLKETLMKAMFHDDVIKWKHCPRNWPFVRGIHRSALKSLHKCQWREALVFFFYPRLNKRLSKQSGGWWLETPSYPLWRNCNVFRNHWYGLRGDGKIMHALFTGRCITVTSQWARRRHKWQSFRLFAQLFVQGRIKESTKASRHWSLWPVDSTHKG